MFCQKRASIRPFIEGFAYAFDLFGVLSPRNCDLEKKGYEKDMEAMYGDWQAIGSDLQKVMKRYSNEYLDKRNVPKIPSSDSEQKN